MRVIKHALRVNGCQEIEPWKNGCYGVGMTVNSPTAVKETPFPYADTEAALMFRSMLDQHVQRHHTSLRRLATELGYKQSTVLSHMASGRVPIPIDRAAEFADYLNVPRAMFIPAVLRQRHPDVLDAVAGDSDEPRLRVELSNLSAFESAKMTKAQQKIVQEVLRDSRPEERWLTPAEVPVVGFLREACPNIFESGLTVIQRRALKEAIEVILP